MARDGDQDFLHDCRFVTGVVSDISDLIVPTIAAGRGEAGFAEIDLPEISVDGPLYREGCWEPWPMPMGGLPGPMTMTFRRGVVFRDTSFYNWVMSAIMRSRSYRADICVLHQHPGTGFRGHQWIWRDCVASGVKPPSLNAMNGTISVWEMSVRPRKPELEVVG